MHLGQIRRAVLLLLVVAGAASAYAVQAGYLHLFAVTNSDRGFTQSCYLLSTTVQALAAVFGITVALLFVTGQFIHRPGHTRLMRAVFWNATTALALSSLVLSVALGTILLARLDATCSGAACSSIDIFIVMSLFSLGLLLPLLIQQFENLNPLAVAVRVAKTISYRSLHAYGLVQISESPGRLRVQLSRWRTDHTRTDPLGAYHEVLLQAIEARDRTLLSLLTRLLLRRISSACGVYYPVQYSPASRDPGGYRIRSLSYKWLRRPANARNRAVVTAHILHYLIRLCSNMKKAWMLEDGKAKDVVRQGFVRNLLDALLSTSDREDLVLERRLIIYAILHICLDYRDTPRHGTVEPLLDAYRIAATLEKCGCAAEAVLLTSVLACIASRTDQIPKDARFEFIEDELTSRLKQEYDTTSERAKDDDAWIPGLEADDPWRQRRNVSVKVVEDATASS